MGLELEHEDWIERDRQRLQAGGKHQIDSDDVQLDEQAMLKRLLQYALRNGSMQLDADNENLITDWTDSRMTDMASRADTG